MRSVPSPIAATIAGSDCSGAAGLQADLPTFAAHGVQVVSTLTVVTAQTSTGVTAFTSCRSTSSNTNYSRWLPTTDQPQPDPALARPSRLLRRHLPSKVTVR